MTRPTSKQDGHGKALPAGMRTGSRTFMRLAIIIILAAVIVCWMLRPLPFNSTDWLSSSAGIASRRFRMSGALVEKLNGERPSRKDVDAWLGNTESPADALVLRYPLGGGPLSGPYYLRVELNETGTVVRAAVYPD